MKHKFYNIKKNLFFAASLCLISFPVFAFEGMEDLKAKSGEKVVIIGEAIGNPIKAKDGAWLNLFDGQEHMSVYVKKPEILDAIRYWGSFKTQGDIVKVSGIYNKICNQHDIADVHLTGFSIHVRGAPNEDYAAPEKQFFSIILIAICLATSLVYFIKIRRPAKTNENKPHARKTK
jgi:hypothetical protein